MWERLAAAILCTRGGNPLLHFVRWYLNFPVDYVRKSLAIALCAAPKLQKISNVTIFEGLF